MKKRIFVFWFAVVFTFQIHVGWRWLGVGDGWGPWTLAFIAYSTLFCRFYESGLNSFRQKSLSPPRTTRLFKRAGNRLKERERLIHSLISISRFFHISLLTICCLFSLFSNASCTTERKEEEEPVISRATTKQSDAMHHIFIPGTLHDTPFEATSDAL